MYEGFCEKMDSIKIERKGTESIGLKCWHCKEEHLTEDCHLITLDKKVLIGRSKLRNLDIQMKKKKKMSSKVIQEDLPFFRKIVETRKVKSPKFVRPRLNIDNYKKRGFSYLEYNIEGIQYFKKNITEKNYES